MSQRVSKEDIDACFDGAVSQKEVAARLYKLVFPDWDSIVKIEGWPKCSAATNKYIFDKFIEFDRIHHPEALGGGLWMNSGWGTAEMEDWVVDTTYCRVRRG